MSPSPTVLAGPCFRRLDDELCDDRENIFLRGEASPSPLLDPQLINTKASSPNIKASSSNTMASSAPNHGPDPDPSLGRHTEPGDDRLILQPNLHKTLATLAAYLGFDHIGTLKQCLFNTRVIQVTRLLFPLVYDPNQRKHLDKVFSWFRTADSDAQVRARCAHSADDIMMCLENWEKEERHSVAAAVAIASLLVWAVEVLSGGETTTSGHAASSSSPVGVGLLEEGSQFAKMLEAVCDSVGEPTCGGMTLEATQVVRLVDEDLMQVIEEEGKRPIHELDQTEYPRPKLDYYPEHNEHEFEKYGRVLALVRGCAQEMFWLVVRHKRLEHGLSSNDMYNKRLMRQLFYFCRHHLPRFDEEGRRRSAAVSWRTARSETRISWLGCATEAHPRMELGIGIAQQHTGLIRATSLEIWDRLIAVPHRRLEVALERVVLVAHVPAQRPTAVQHWVRCSRLARGSIVSSTGTCLTIAEKGGSGDGTLKGHQKSLTLSTLSPSGLQIIQYFLGYRISPLN
ncbi:uncharacterized protein PG986_005714 [Apiospora aurea]|uniref:Uncharacterized protein n=1 Tax=Apiospora aurea TaxID=335848 RepID=A0ABR1QIC2_9PEZI